MTRLLPRLEGLDSTAGKKGAFFYRHYLLIEAFRAFARDSQMVVIIQFAICAYAVGGADFSPLGKIDRRHGKDIVIGLDGGHAGGQLPEDLRRVLIGIFHLRGQLLRGARLRKVKGKVHPCV